jgi:hypothetical protein
MYVIVVGTMVDGYQIHGPFVTREAADTYPFPTYPTSEDNECHWFVYELIAPEDHDESETDYDGSE